MVRARQGMVVYCFDTLVAHYTGELVPAPTFDKGQHSLFVAWKRVIGGELTLRGWAGSLEATCISKGLKDYTLRSALLGGRFPAIEGAEIPNLECTVSILTDYEDAANYLDWEIGKHGIIIEFTDSDSRRRVGTYLPEVAAEQGWTKTETIDSLMRQSGYMGNITESLPEGVRIIRYQTSVYSMHYTEYVTFAMKTKGEAQGEIIHAMG